MSPTIDVNLVTANVKRDCDLCAVNQYDNSNKEKRFVEWKESLGMCSKVGMNSSTSLVSNQILCAGSFDIRLTPVTAVFEVGNVQH